VTGVWKPKIVDFKLVREDLFESIVVAKWQVDARGAIEGKDLVLASTVNTGIAGNVTLQLSIREADALRQSSNECKFIELTSTQRKARDGLDFAPAIEPLRNFFRDQEFEFISLVPKLFTSVILPILKHGRVDPALVILEFLKVLENPANDKLERKIYLLATAVHLLKWCRKHDPSSDSTRLLNTELAKHYVQSAFLMGDKFGELHPENCFTKCTEIISWVITIGRGLNSEIMFMGILAVFLVSHCPDMAATLAGPLLIKNPQILAILHHPDQNLLHKSKAIADYVVRRTTA
jgi:hypothetical protein